MLKTDSVLLAIVLLLFPLAAFRHMRQSFKEYRKAFAIQSLGAITVLTVNYFVILAKQKSTGDLLDPNYLWL